MVALLYYIPDRRRKGSPPLLSENQEEREAGPHNYTDELPIVAHFVGRYEHEYRRWVMHTTCVIETE